MTEAEWLTEDDLGCLLDFLEEKASRRKLRLFAIGCLGRIVPLLPDGNCRSAVELAEAIADGQTTLDSLRAIHNAFEREATAARQNTARVEREGMFYFATKQDALVCDFQSVAQAATKEDFDAHVRGCWVVDLFLGK
jgi:hypothetical protein